MKKFTDARWLFAVHTLPVSGLLFLLIREYAVVKHLLIPDDKELWVAYISVLALITVLQVIYATYLVICRQKIHWLYATLLLVLHIGVLWFAGSKMESLHPDTVPAWMTSGSPFLYSGAFLMPVMAYALFVMVLHLTPLDSRSKPWKNFLVAIAVPLAWYLFTQLLMPLWHYGFGSGKMHVMIVFAVMSTILFLFFLIRGLYLILRRQSGRLRRYHLIWEIPIAVIFPLLGLSINNGHFAPMQGWAESGIFGNFGSPVFYILAIANGILVCLPQLQNARYRLALFICRSATFAYTLYFFIVFLPFLPLSVIAIIAFGAGFLMLTPLVLFAIHVQKLRQDYQYLKHRLSATTLAVLAFVAFLIIPSGITISYLHKRSVLHNALEYVYAPDFKKKYNIDLASFGSTIEIIKHHKDERANSMYNTPVPFLSGYFNWIVLDNLTLSDQKINQLDYVFRGGPLPEQVVTFNNPDTEIKISGTKTESVYDTANGVWETWVHFNLKNQSQNEMMGEYATQFQLPNGCFISDYYLYVGNKKEMGLLAEKRAAKWVYSNILSENRDPGILFYSSNNRINFRVFPFSRNELRRTGIRFVHKEPAVISIDSQKVQLGSSVAENSQQAVHIQNVTYIPASVKTSLQKIKRKSYYHFIADASFSAAKHQTETKKLITQFLAKNRLNDEAAVISFVGTYAHTVPLQHINEAFRNVTYKGGFFLDRALKQSIAASYFSNEDRYPVFIVVSNQFENGMILNHDFSELRFAYPDADVFYELKDNGELLSHALFGREKESDKNSIAQAKTVHLYADGKRKVYIPDDGAASVILNSSVFQPTDMATPVNGWQTGLIMQGKWMAAQLSPHQGDADWLNGVKQSFQSKIMSPSTAFIVVENEAQKGVLLRKQAAILNGNPSLDAGEDTERMSEPGLFVMIVLLVLILLARHRSRQKLRPRL